MAKKRSLAVSQMFAEVKGESITPTLERERFTADVLLLIDVCENYRGKFTEPFKINSYMLINNFDKFFNTQIQIMNTYPEEHFLAQSAITRLSFFRNYINNSHAQNK